GNSSLDFQLRVWVADFNDGVSTQTALMLEINQRFRDASIEIPFQQQDFHFRSMDDAAIAQFKQIIASSGKRGAP
ncbi:hypothetical protein LJC41_04075, partial [Desulfosarcina sp. OttesenSCG-928-G17]|nr:hypothetical protein [Desulfosarcina sp. OttesenSCG-928-G17]